MGAVAEKSVTISNEKPEFGRRLTTVGIAISVLWLLALGAFAAARWSAMVDMRPNEVGDFLAGAFAPLAFFWLVLGFFQQGKELRYSGKALWLQGEELRNSVEQQRQLVDVTRDQLLFETSRMQREAERARALAQPKLELTLGGWGSLMGARDQSFSLTNHGQSCTRVRLTFNNEWHPISVDRLAGGERKIFNIQIQHGMQPVQATASYLDAHQEPGETIFEISFSDEEPDVATI